MKLAVTATQRGLTPKQYEAAFTFILTLHIDEFHHGGCVGGDYQLQKMMATGPPELRAARIIMHRGSTPEKWDVRCDDNANSIIEPKDNIERNHDMVDICSELLACPGEDAEVLRSGTWATIRYAVKKGIPVYIVYPDGTFEIRR